MTNTLVLTISPRLNREFIHSKVLRYNLSVLVSLSVAVTNIQWKQFRGGKIYFGSWFQRFYSKIADSVAPGTMVRLNNMMGAYHRVTQFKSWWTGRRGRIGKGKATRYIFSGCTPSDLLLPTKLHHLLFTISQLCHPILNPSMN
jgi:hypothetical protein